MEPVHIINIDIPDNHEEATIGAFIVCELAKQVRSSLLVSYTTAHSVRHKGFGFPLIPALNCCGGSTKLVLRLLQYNFCFFLKPLSSFY